MSAWQSFFNQLSKPVNVKDSSSVLNDLCHCDEGSLSFKSDNYHPKGNCSLSLVCCAIQIDKHRAHIFNNCLTTPAKSKSPVLGKSDPKLFPLDTIIDR
jgi:hypothetical protein